MKTYSLPHPQTQLLAAKEGSVIDKLADFPLILSVWRSPLRKSPLNQNWPLSLLTADGDHISFAPPWSPSERDFSACPCTLHLHCSPFIPGTLQIPAVPAGWAAAGHHPTGWEQHVQAVFPTCEGATRGSFLDQTLFGTFSALTRCSHVVNQHEFPPGYLLFNCSFLLPSSETGRFARALSSSSHIYDFGEVGQGENEAATELQMDHAFLGLFSPDFISPVAAHVSLPWCLPTQRGLIFPPLAQGFSLCNLLFTSNLVKDRQHVSELGLNGAQAFESLTSSWLQLWMWSNREQHAQQTPATFTWSWRDLYIHTFAERLDYAEHAKYRLLSIFGAFVKQKISIAEETVGDFSFSPPLPPLVQCLYSVFSSSLCLTGILVC